MTFLGLDLSRDDSAPIEFYEFILGTEVWRYTTAATDQVLGVQTYTAAVIKRSDKELTGEITGKRLTITVAGYDPLVDKYKNAVPPEPMSVKVYRRHRNDVGFIVVWSGVVRSVNWANTTAALACEHIAMAVGRVGLYRFYQTLCSHIWGGPSCRVSSEDFKTTAVISSADSTSISCSTAQVDGYFKNGFARYGNDYRMITSSTMSLIEVSFPFYEITPGETIDLYAGCDRLLGTCVEKFNNSINFGGCPYVPSQNVFIVGVE